MSTAVSTFTSDNFYHCSAHSNGVIFLVIQPLITTFTDENNKLDSYVYFNNQSQGYVCKLLLHITASQISHIDNAL